MGDIKWNASGGNAGATLLRGTQGIHKLDQKRKGFAFITVHCSTISESLAESELFGHRRGAFSGAVADRKGRFEDPKGFVVRALIAPEFRDRRAVVHKTLFRGFPV